MFRNGSGFARFALASAGLLSLLCLTAAPSHAQVTVYNNNFNNGSTTGFTSSDLIIGTRTNGAQTYLATPGTVYGFDPGTATLTLNSANLVGTVTVGFDLYIIGSMDGNGPAGGGADPWGLTANGNSLIFTNFANATVNNTQAFASLTSYSNFSPGVAPRTGSDTALAGQLGYGAGNGGDATYHLTFTFANATPNLVLNFFSQQNEGAGNEGWGLDNVVVTSRVTPAVPEPGSVALLVGMGLSGAGLLVRRRRTRRAVSK